jgi:hypothetical protein
LSRVYSSQLFAGDGLGGGGPTPLASPPAGTVWVIRSMSAAFTEPTSVPLDGFVVMMNGALWLWSTVFPVVGQFAYQWDGRHVLGASDTLDFSSPDSALWSLVVSGYQLTLP